MKRAAQATFDSVGVRVVLGSGSAGGEVAGDLRNIDGRISLERQRERVIAGPGDLVAAVDVELGRPVREVAGAGGPSAYCRPGGSTAMVMM